MEDLNRAVYPWDVYLPTALVYRQARLAVVEAADDYVHACENSESDIIDDISIHPCYVNVRVYFHGSFSGYFSFEPSAVFCTKED